VLADAAAHAAFFIRAAAGVGQPSIGGEERSERRLQRLDACRCIRNARREPLGFVDERTSFRSVDEETESFGMVTMAEIAHGALLRTNGSPARGPADHCIRGRAKSEPSIRRRCTRAG